MGVYFYCTYILYKKLYSKKLEKVEHYFFYTLP